MKERLVFGLLAACLLATVRAKVRRCCAGDTCQHHDFTCPADGTGTWANPENCQQYYTCLNGMTSPEKCPEGTMFDVNHMACAKEAEMNCAGRPTTDTTTCIYVCDEQLGLFPNEQDATNRSYFYCYDYVPALMYCPPGTAYTDAENGICK